MYFCRILGDVKNLKLIRQKIVLVLTTVIRFCYEDIGQIIGVVTLTIIAVCEDWGHEITN